MAGEKVLKPKSKSGPANNNNGGDEEEDLQLCAKKVLQELRDMEKEDIINELLDQHQIQDESELMELENDLQGYFANEYGVSGNILSLL